MKGSLQYCFSPKPNLDFEGIAGSGSFGTVFKAYDRNLRKFVAVKRSIKLGQTISREYTILKEVAESPQCITLLDIFYTVNDTNDFIQHLIFDFIPDNLSRVLRSRYKEKNNFSLTEIRKIMLQILRGLEFLHGKNIMHRDIKPENILIREENCEIKICDFGSAKFDDEKENIPYVVSRFYRAPELILACEKYGKEVDVWAAGCILMELFVGIPLFMGVNDGDQLVKQINVLGPIGTDCEIIRNSKVCPEILAKLSQIGNKVEISKLIEIECPLAVDLVENMLKYDPKERLTASQCLQHNFFKETN